jgi:hypothetical protein
MADSSANETSLLGSSVLTEECGQRALDLLIQSIVWLDTGGFTVIAAHANLAKDLLTKALVPAHAFPSVQPDEDGDAGL